MEPRGTPFNYNRVAGQSLGRLAALSDGVFAIAMTLLVLDLRVPLGDFDTDGALWSHLMPLVPNFVAYILSFMTLGIFWVGQQTQIESLTRADRDLTWLHLGFLLTVTFMPFSTGLLAGHIHLRSALLIYWLNILLLGAVLYITWRYALRAKFVRDDTPELRTAIQRRILVAQGLYAFGALLCIISTYISIAVIVLVQLNYVFAPRLRVLYRL